MEDYASIWASISAAPDRQVGEHRKPWSNEEDWILWEMWKRKRQPDTAKAFQRSVGACRIRYEELTKQGGPKGKRPEWMK